MDANKIVTIARSYVGQTEVLGNKGFTDPSLLAKMKLAGWAPGYAWCALLAEIIWKESVGPNNPVWLLLDKLFSASALSTYYNFAHSKDFTATEIPVPGALVIWKHGIDPKQWTGHAGIVTTNTDKDFHSVEGNTSGKDPNIREGYIVAEKPHVLGLPPNPKGLNVLGFIPPLTN